MKFLILFFVLYVNLTTAFSQEVTGDWYGTLNAVGVNLRLVFHIQKDGNTFRTTLDSPDQGSKGIPAAVTSVKDSVLEIKFLLIGAVYKGTYANEEIKGIFSQSGLSMELNLTREEIKRQRPQEPKPPYPYYTEEIVFENPKADITLAGTLTLPQKKGNYPAVVLISGSGPQNRDEEILGHKPFLVIADHLTRHGIAVLRFDDRGTARSGGDYASASVEDLATDAEAAVEYLQSRKEINPDLIGLLGHSEGGMIAPMIASHRKDIAFLILLAAPGIPGTDLLLQQQTDILKQQGSSEEEIQATFKFNQKVYELIHSLPKEKLQDSISRFITQEMPELPFIKKYPPEQQEKIIGRTIHSVLSPEILSIIKSKPADYLQQVRCPVLALNGEKDLQVNAAQNLQGIKKALEQAGNPFFQIFCLPRLNHLFQECETGSPEEYIRIPQTISPQVLEIMVKWIKK